MSNSGIYKLYWPDLDYFYIGQSVHVGKRYSKHKRMLKNNIHENSRLQNIYNRHGIPYLEVIIYSAKHLDELEQVLLNINFEKECCCNLAPTANSTKGYKHTQECKIRIGQLSKQKVYTEEYRAKLRARPVNKTMLGKTHTSEAKKKMSEARKGTTKSMEWREKISISNKNRIRPNQRPLINPLTGESFLSINLAAEHYKIHPDTLAYHLKRNQSFLKYSEPKNVRSIILSSSGALSTNEA